MRKGVKDLPLKDLGMSKDLPDPRFWTGNLLLPMEKQDTAETDREHKISELITFRNENPVAKMPE